MLKVKKKLHIRDAARNTDSQELALTTTIKPLYPSDIVSSSNEIYGPMDTESKIATEKNTSKTMRFSEDVNSRDVIFTN
jgi:hypothetical protein